MAGPTTPAGVVERYLEAYRRRDVDAILDLFADEVETGAGARDREAFRPAFELWMGAFPDIAIEVDELVADDRHAVLCFRFTGTHEGPFRAIEPTGQTVDVPEALLFRVEDGLITRFSGVWDRLTFYEQLGLTEVPST